MSPRVVVDASVVSRWLVPVAGNDTAEAVLQEYLDGQFDLFAPHLQRAEVGNALWKYYRSGLLTIDQLSNAFALYLDFAPQFADSATTASTALQLAAAHGCSVYDATYLALSLELQADLATADRKMVRQLSGAFPGVRFVGSD